MRSVKGSVLGLVLCWTVVCTGIQAHGKSNEDSLTSNVEDILDLLKAEQLFLSVGAEEPVEDAEKCSETKLDECTALNQLCKKESDEEKCDGCIKGFSMDKDSICKECDCGDATCELDDKGKKKECECTEKQQEHGGKCVDCDCGNADCELDDKGKKKDCVCTGKQQVFEGKCIDCDCGEAACELDISGKKNCTCAEKKQKEHDGKCIECDCGDATCELDDKGQKKNCKCTEKQQVHDGKCVDCDCGDATCELDDKGQKKDCKCTEKQQEHGGKCVACDCGDASCKLDDTGKKMECECSAKQKAHGGKCVECDCGDATCELDDKGKKKDCKCTEKQQVHGGKCVACDCGDASCKLDNSGKKMECTCGAKQKEHGGKCVACDCGDAICDLDESGKKKKCHCTESQREKDGKCFEIKTCEKEGDAVCKMTNRVCVDQKQADFKCDACIETHADDGKGNCRETCDKEDKDDCKHNGTCNEKRFCDCLTGFSGDKCHVVDECVTGNYKNCKGTNGTCKFVDEKNKVVCECDGNKALKEDENICRTKCSKDTDCNNGKCSDSKFCLCDKGYIGDICDTIKGCDKLKCNEASATCKYNKLEDKAYCDCNDPNYAFVNGNCKTAKWCSPDPCVNAECVFKDGIGSCKCSAEDNYYDYRQGGCKKINPCLSQKPCGGNKECDSSTGKCKCIDGFQADGEECKRKNVCNLEPCFRGATCTEGDKPNVVKCSCKDNQFYRKEGCADASCFVPGQNCTKCPTGTKKNNNDCEPEEGKKCDKDCGFGFCIKEGDKENCVCKDSVYITKKENKCVLNTIACASGLRTKDLLECNCTGIFKMGQNKVTCERKSCADADAQEDCKNKKAKCVDDWKSAKRAYNCKCDDGYVLDPIANICTDRCSQKKPKDTCAVNKQVCFLTNTEDLDCKCQPTFTLKDDANGKRCEPTDQGLDVMLHNLPVKSDRYRKDHSIDYVKLNKDIINAMEAIYPKNELASAKLYKYKSKNDNVLLCEVWLQFNKDATKQVNRWKVQKSSKDSTIFLAPDLVLSSDEEVNEVQNETLTFCSVKDTHCGQYAVCKDKKCTCYSGYRTIKSTVSTYGDFVSLYCEDINECAEGSDGCTTNTTCMNTLGDYYCKCKDGFKKTSGPASAENKNSCTDLCDPSPCGKGKCKNVNNTADCTCDPGYGGSFCNREDANFKSASKNTVVVGAVLGTLLGVLVILFVLYILRQRKNSYSEDFTPAPRIDNAEMVDRRPMRGVGNKAYQ